MIEGVPDHQCTGCTACAQICPKNCIQMIPDSEGFLHPQVDAAQCISCSLCTRTCPVLHQPTTSDAQTQAYAAMIAEEPVRLKSTSGGTFTALARWVFRHGGVVFGAAYAEDFSVYHCAVTDEEQLQMLRTAKYAQSRLGDTFAQVKTALKQGREVLFSGTPCQIAGLQAYLKKSYENLILADVICHGVPSPKVWRHYLDFRRKTDAPDSAIKSVNLRSKETGWPSYSIRFEYENGSVYSARSSEDPFLRGFVGDYYLRPSCYECPFKGISRPGDFTLADYWGVDGQLPEYDDGKGTSLVFVHSEKGKRIWEAVQKDLRCQMVDPELAVKWNPSALTASRQPDDRDAFWNRYEQANFGTLIEELLPPPPAPVPPSFYRRAVGKIRRMIHKWGS